MMEMPVGQKVETLVEQKTKSPVGKKIEMPSEKKQKSTSADIAMLENVELNVSSRLSLRVGSCNSKELVSLIKELEGGLC